MNLYRIFPILWDGCDGAATVYAIDRTPPSGTFSTACTSRNRSDPAYTWDGSTTQRLLPPPNSSGCWYQNAVTWSQLPAWISWVRTFGYSLQEGTKLKPMREFYIEGP